MRTSSPSRISTRRGNASAIARSCVIVTIVDPAACSSCSSARMLRAGARVEVAGRLVGEQDRGPPDERPRDRHPLALAARELRRRVREPVRQPDGVQRLARPRPPRAPAPRRCRAARSRRCRARSSRRAGRTAGRRTRSRAPAAPPARARPASRCPGRRRAPRPRSAAPASPSRAAASTCPSPDGPTTAHASPARTVKRHAAQRLDAARVGLAHVDEVEHRRRARRRRDERHSAVTTLSPSCRPSPCDLDQVVGVQARRRRVTMPRPTTSTAYPPPWRASSALTGTASASRRRSTAKPTSTGAWSRFPARPET